MKQKLLLKTMLLLFALIAGSSSVWAVEQVYKTLTFCNSGTDTNKTNGYESSWDETVGTEPNTFSWTISNFNNNNWGWLDGDYKLIKCGRKKGKSENTPSVATITTKAVIDEAITKVVVTLNAINASDYNSIKLYMASNEDFDENLVTVNVSPIPTAAGAMTITIPEANRAANRFYKIEFDTKGTTSGNGHTAVKMVEYYYDYVTSASLDHITLSGTYPTEFYVGDAFSHEGMTVTAHYSDATTLDVTGSATFTGYNMSSAGDQTVTVSYEESSVTKSTTYGITVNPIPPVVLTLDFATNIFGLPVGSANKQTESTGYSYGGYTYTLAASTGFYYGEFQGYNCLFMGKSGSTLTFPAFPFKVKMIKVYGTSSASAVVKQNIFVGDDPISTETTGAKDVTNVYNIPSAYQNAGTVYILKVTSDANTQISKIEILADAETVTVTDAGWASFSSASALAFTGTGVTAYIAKANGGSSVTLTEIEKVPANTGIVVNAAEGTYAIPVLSGAADATTGNLLKPWLTAGTPTAETYYTLAVNAGNPIFKKSSGGTLAAGKAYLDLSGASAPVLNVTFETGEGNSTGVNDVRSKMEEGRGEFYNLNGQRVAQPTKGLYIVNGKKVLVK